MLLTPQCPRSIATVSDQNFDQKSPQVEYGSTHGSVQFGRALSIRRDASSLSPRRRRRVCHNLWICSILECAEKCMTYSCSVFAFKIPSLVVCFGYTISERQLSIRVSGGAIFVTTITSRAAPLIASFGTYRVTKQ